MNGHQAHPAGRVLRPEPVRALGARRRGRPRPARAPAGELSNVRPGQTLTTQFLVDGTGFDVSTQRPGSDVAPSLTVALGRVIDRRMLAMYVTDVLGSMFESLRRHVGRAGHLQDTATMLSTRGPARARRGRLGHRRGAVEEPSRPAAGFEQSLSWWTLSVDGTTISDIDGHGRAVYLWKFGDGR